MIQTELKVEFVEWKVKVENIETISKTITGRAVHKKTDLLTRKKKPGALYFKASDVTARGCRLFPEAGEDSVLVILQHLAVFANRCPVSSSKSLNTDAIQIYVPYLQMLSWYAWEIISGLLPDGSERVSPASQKLWKHIIIEKKN